MASGKKTVVVFGVATLVVGALWSLGPLVFAGHDDPTAIDSKPVRRPVRAGCTQLRAALAAVPAGLGVPDRAEAENRAVERLLAQVRALGPDALAHDDPVEQWLG